MPPTAIPTPVPVYSSGILHGGDYINHYRDELLQWLGAMPTPTATWMQLVLHYHWSGDADLKNDMYVTFDITNITAGAMDPTWITADFTTVEARFDTFTTAIAAIQSPLVVLTEYRWYARSFNPYTVPKPFAPHGAPVRITPKATPGTGSGYMPPQVAITVTERTPFPRNWGRFYIPAIANSTISSSTPPKIVNASVDAIATAANALWTGLASSDFQIVVPITSLGTGARGTPGVGTPNRRLATVTQLSVDNVFDVQRKRRTHLPTYRKTFP